MKDAQRTTKTAATTVRTSFLEAIVDANPKINPGNNSIEDGAASVVEVVEIETGETGSDIPSKYNLIQTLFSNPRLPLSLF